MTGRATDGAIPTTVPADDEEDEAEEEEEGRVADEEEDEGGIGDREREGKASALKGKGRGTEDDVAVAIASAAAAAAPPCLSSPEFGTDREGMFRCLLKLLDHTALAEFALHISLNSVGTGASVSLNIHSSSAKYRWQRVPWMEPQGRPRSRM